MSYFLCSLWWFILGLFVGWLLAWWLARCNNFEPQKASIQRFSGNSTSATPSRITQPATTGTTAAFGASLPTNTLKINAVSAPAASTATPSAMPRVTAGVQTTTKPVLTASVSAKPKPITISESEKPEDRDAAGLAAWVGAAKSAGITVRNEDDLEIVEGIGPKIHALLHAEGICSLSQLAHTPTASILNILQKAGARFQLANPGTWPEQARLASTGQWVELKTFQDKLTGGVFVPRNSK